LVQPWRFKNKDEYFGNFRIEPNFER